MDKINFNTPISPPISQNEAQVGVKGVHHVDSFCLTQDIGPPEIKKILKTIDEVTQKRELISSMLVTEGSLAVSDETKENLLNIISNSYPKEVLEVIARNKCKIYVKGEEPSLVGSGLLEDFSLDDISEVNGKLKEAIEGVKSLDEFCVYQHWMDELDRIKHFGGGI